MGLALKIEKVTSIGKVPSLAGLHNFWEPLVLILISKTKSNLCLMFGTDFGVETITKTF